MPPVIRHRCGHPDKMGYYLRQLLDLLGFATLYDLQTYINENDVLRNLSSMTMCANDIAIVDEFAVFLGVPKPTNYLVTDNSNIATLSHWRVIASVLRCAPSTTNIKKLNRIRFPAVLPKLRLL